MQKTIVIFVFLLFAQVDLLHATHGKYAVYGHGTGSCGEWTESRNQDRLSYHAVWIKGWISAAGYYEGELANSDSPALDAWMDNYCKANPLDGIVDGAEKLVEELKQRHSRDFDLGDFAPEEVEHPPLWEPVSKDYEE